MDVIHQRVAGLDVHKETIVACVRIMVDARVSRECRTFDTTTAGLKDLLAWLTASGCSHVAMEATGVYWKPVWNILSDGTFELLVACGLIRGSFVPDQAFQELRTLLRTRKQLTREQTRHVQRLQKTLEEANIKLDSVISDVMGLSGRRMVEAMIAGERNPQKLAALADRRIKASPKALYDALHGRLTDHHRFRLRLHLAQYDVLAAAIGAVDQEVDAAIDQMDEVEKGGQAFFRSLIRLLSGIPGVNTLSAQTILAEITPDMTRFATAGHLVAWAGLCPGQNESAGKRKSSRLRKGAPWLKTTLVQCAASAVKKKDSYFKAQFQRLKSRRGPQKAICAVAAAMLTTIYHMLKDGTQFQDLGAHHFDRRPPEAKARHLVAQLTKLGYTVQLQPLAEAA